MRNFATKVGKLLEISKQFDRNQIDIWVMSLAIII